MIHRQLDLVPFILNAEKQSQQRIHLLKSLPSEPAKKRSELIKQAIQLHSKWTTDFGSIHFGACLYLLSDDRNRSQTYNLNLLDSVTKAKALHSVETCTKACTEENHRTQSHVGDRCENVIDGHQHQVPHQMASSSIDQLSNIPDDAQEGNFNTADEGRNQSMDLCEDLIKNIDYMVESLKKDIHPLSEISLRQILQHWTVKWGIVQEAIEDLIRLLQLVKPEANYHDLPKSAKTLLKIPDKDNKKIVKVTPVHYPVVGGAPEEVGEIMYLGVANAIHGTSIGILHVWEFRQLFKLIDFVFPKLLPRQTLRSIIENTTGDSEQQVASSSSSSAETTSTTNDDVKFTISLDINIDGVSWFSSTIEKVVPILGKFFSISDGTTTVKLPSKQKPFIISIYRGKKKCRVQDLVGEFIEEMKILGDPSKSGLPFIVKISSLICDAPMRAELKGVVNFNGYYSCERCKTEGVNIAKGNGNSMRFPRLDEKRRIDSEWKKYKRPRDAAHVSKLMFY